jgi:signal peptidase II
MNLRLIQGLGLSCALIFIDQWSKYLVISSFQQGQGIFITSYLNIIRVHNPGAAFSFLATGDGWQRWFFSSIAIIASFVIILMMRESHRLRLYTYSLALILAGAVGNLIDRLIHGYVIDFIDVHSPLLTVIFASGHYPTFNVADSCILTGIFLYLWVEWKKAD